MVHQPLGKSHAQVLVAMRVDVPLHLIGANRVNGAMEHVAEVFGVVGTQPRLRGRGGEDRGCDVELKVELNGHNAIGLYPQSPAPGRCEAQGVARLALFFTQDEVNNEPPIVGFSHPSVRDEHLAVSAVRVCPDKLHREPIDALGLKGYG